MADFWDRIRRISGPVFLMISLAASPLIPANECLGELPVHKLMSSNLPVNTIILLL